MSSNLKLRIIDTEFDFQVINIFLDGNGQIDSTDLKKIELKSINRKKGIVLSGRSPLFLIAYLSAMLKDKVKYVAVFQPQFGGIVVCPGIGKTSGTIISKKKVLPYIPRSKNEKTIAFVGPPHSGKSVLMNALRLSIRENLKPAVFHRDFFIVRACPDGEGDWYADIPQLEAVLLRYKNRFDDSFVTSAVNSIKSFKEFKKYIFVDCGGKIDKKNQKLFNECTHAIIVSNSKEKTIEWKGALLASELKLLFEVQSILKGKSRFVSPDTFIMSGLDRNNKKLRVAPEMLDLIKSKN